jgi:uncharacterized protein YutE (UPF0331/DUF86 family)
VVVDRERIEAQLLGLERAAATLRKLSGVTAQEMDESLEKAWTIQRGLQVAIQTVLDIGGHILSDTAPAEVEDYTDIIDGMARHGILTANLARRIRPMAGFRNLLVHGYARIDHGKVQMVLAQYLDDFETFSREMRDYLRRVGV